MRLVVLDFDGVIVANGAGEKIFRFILKKLGFKRPPKIFFDTFEILNIFKKTHRIKPETKRLIQECRQKKCMLGLITDESLFSIYRFLKKNKELSLKDFDFIQTRKSFLNKFSEISSLIGALRKPRLYVSKFVKPHRENLANVKIFAEEKSISRQEILFIDDLEEARISYQEEGFPAIDTP